MSRPYNGYYRRIEEKAAALVQSVASNHGFADGNKRTALILVRTLLERSGFQLCARAKPPELINEAVEQMILGAVIGDMTFDDLVAWFRERIRRK